MFLISRLCLIVRWGLVFFSPQKIFAHGFLSSLYNRWSFKRARKGECALPFLKEQGFDRKRMRNRRKLWRFPSEPVKGQFSYRMKNFSLFSSSEVQNSRRPECSSRKCNSGAKRALRWVNSENCWVPCAWNWTQMSDWQGKVWRKTVKNGDTPKLNELFKSAVQGRSMNFPWKGAYLGSTVMNFNFPVAIWTSQKLRKIVALQSGLLRQKLHLE